MKAVRIMVYFEDELVEDRVLQVKKPLVIGDDPDAAVHFPGWTLPITPISGALTIDGEVLAYHDPRSFTWAGVRVVVEAVRTYELAREPIWETDLRFPVLMMAVFLMLMGFQSFSKAISIQMERGPLMVAGWILVTPGDEAPITDANPNFDLEALDRMGTFQDVHTP